MHECLVVYAERGFFYGFAHNLFVNFPYFYNSASFSFTNRSVAYHSITAPPLRGLVFFKWLNIPAWLAWENHFLRLKRNHLQTTARRLNWPPVISQPQFSVPREKSGNPVGSLHRKPCHKDLSNPQPRRDMIGTFFRMISFILLESVFFCTVYMTKSFAANTGRSR